MSRYFSRLAQRTGLARAKGSLAQPSAAGGVVADGDVRGTDSLEQTVMREVDTAGAAPATQIANVTEGTVTPSTAAELERRPPVASTPVAVNPPVEQRKSPGPETVPDNPPVLPGIEDSVSPLPGGRVNLPRQAAVVAQPQPGPTGDAGHLIPTVDQQPRVAAEHDVAFSPAPAGPEQAGDRTQSVAEEPRVQWPEPVPWSGTQTAISATDPVAIEPRVHPGDGKPGEPPVAIESRPVMPALNVDDGGYPTGGLDTDTAPAVPIAPVASPRAVKIDIGRIHLQVHEKKESPAVVAPPPKPKSRPAAPAAPRLSRYHFRGL